MLTKEGDKAACRRESKNSTGICRTFRSGLYASAIRACAGEEQTAGKRCFDAKLIRANSLIFASSSWEQFGSSTGNSKNTVFRAAPILLPNQQMSTSRDTKKPQNTKVFGACFGGATRNRTGDEGFADPCLTAWLWRRMERETGLEPATSALARLRSTK